MRPKVARCSSCRRRRTDVAYSLGGILCGECLELWQTAATPPPERPTLDDALAQLRRTYDRRRSA